MKQIRAIRILMAALFFAASAACLTVGPQVHPMARAARSLQITLSAASVTLGVTFVWLLMTFIFGRIYCAAVCPVGTFGDIFFRLGRKAKRFRRPFRYRHRSRWSVHILWVYILCLIAGVAIVPLLIEPWNIAANMAGAANRGALATAWTTIGLGASAGVCAGVASALILALLGMTRGREFCTRWCPLGTMLGYVQEYSLTHIEIDPDKCISCGRCEDNCRAQCIKIVSRHIDQSRCVRCFDCVADCPTGAIRYQMNRNRRPASPLMRRVRN